MRKKNPITSSSLSFLFPRHVVKAGGFSSRDVKNIKHNLILSFSNVYAIVAAVILVLVTSILTYMHIATNNHYIAKYGITAFAGSILIISGAFITLVLVGLTKFFIKQEKVRIVLCRIAGDMLYFCASAYMLGCMFADAQMGFTVTDEAISASIVFIAVLLLIQPMDMLDALIFDVGTSLGVIGVSVYCKQVYGMKGVYYYGLTALIYPFFCYIIISLLFYAECQRYKELLSNERLHNHAYYDSLTQCKNRYALSEFLNENKGRWENKENANLLIVLFDIDDFRLYNNQFSHLGGDYCLKSICEAIRREFLSPNLDFFRYGGEEFLLFFELKDDSEGKEILQKVRLAISKLNILAPEGAPKKNVTISVGGLLVKNVKSFEFEKEMDMVDSYLYKAKASGKDVVCYNGSIIN